MRARPRPEGARTLKQAAATLFSMLALLPLLIFLWTLHRLHALEEPTAQIGLGLSLLIAVLGFVVLRRLMGLISHVMQLTATAARAAHAGRLRSWAAPPAATVDGPQAPAGQPERSRGRVMPRGTGTRATHAIAATPELGTIREIRDMTAAVSALWRREAEAHVGGVVKVEVVNSPAPIVGTLLQVTDDGLLLEHDGERFGVVWRRIAVVEADRMPATT